MKRDPDLAVFDLDAPPAEPLNRRCEACGAPESVGCNDDCGARAYPPKRCGNCPACEADKLGCLCDDGLDDGCFHCAPQRHPRPPCPLFWSTDPLSLPDSKQWIPDGPIWRTALNERLLLTNLVGAVRAYLYSGCQVSKTTVLYRALEAAESCLAKPAIVMPTDTEAPPPWSYKHRPASSSSCARCKAPHHRDGSDITWRCLVCNNRVCRDCTLTKPARLPLEYHAGTFCSQMCWEMAGSPED